MKRLKNEINLIGVIETISMMELRERPGEIFTSVELGKVFVVKRNGKPLAIISAVPGTQLTIKISSKGEKSYTL